LAEWRHESGRDSSPSFGIKICDDGASVYNCFTCKSKGDLAGLAFALARYRDEPELREYGKKVQQDEILGGTDDFGTWEEKGKSVKAEKSDRITKFPSYRDFLQRFDPVWKHPAALNYLARRGIGFYAVATLGLRFDYWSQRIIFPVFDQWTGRYAGCSGRTILNKRGMEEYEQRDGRPYPKVRDYHGLEKRKLLLRLRPTHRPPSGGLLREPIPELRGRLLGVEGLFAFARFTQLGLGRSTFAILGSVVTEEKATWLKEQDSAIYWFVDPDKAGRTCLWGYDPQDESVTNEDKLKGRSISALEKLYGHAAQFIPSYPPDKLDPDLLDYEDVINMMDSAEFYARSSDNRPRR
jgi:hypothetical protein